MAKFSETHKLRDDVQDSTGKLKIPLRLACLERVMELERAQLAEASFG
jgi:hypothetical protein